ncbi:MAG TPA: hypothetical protein VGX25_07620 [Actinophytocola sp.]|uniref:hypothetical protein n=1 Tax=Actinophytocola sp. TaxID=1872138 RepID=UPI002DDD8C74|nr:hypothetical protein [Actinophytocola sp.]HEV2779255.1 hypothetical protein [Actinophytocola sp.]
MSMLTGAEPAHWHGESGEHQLYDPRDRPWWNPRRAKAAELAYVRHLTAHELAGSRGRQATDSPEVAELFDRIDKYRQLINAAEAEIDRLRLRSAEQ